MPQRKTVAVPMTHWKHISYCFPAACGSSEPTWVDMDGNLTVVDCPPCKAALAKWRHAQKRK